MNWIDIEFVDTKTNNKNIIHTQLHKLRQLDYFYSRYNNNKVEIEFIDNDFNQNIYDMLLLYVQTKHKLILKSAELIELILYLDLMKIKIDKDRFNYNITHLIFDRLYELNRIDLIEIFGFDYETRQKIINNKYKPLYKYLETSNYLYYDKDNQEIINFHDIPTNYELYEVHYKKSTICETDKFITIDIKTNESNKTKILKFICNKSIICVWSGHKEFADKLDKIIINNETSYIYKKTLYCTSFYCLYKKSN